MAEGPFILALDQGTTSSRALLVDSQGAVLRVAAEEFRQFYPAPGWVEHDPLEIWNTQLSSARRVLADQGVSAADLAGVGITNQRETTLLWRRSDRVPVHPAIVWQDRRTAARCEALRSEGRAEWLQERTGLVPDPYFSATKLEWLLDHVDGARAAAEDGDLAFGTVDTWLMWQLSEGHAHRTDRTNASRTLLWNLREERWDPELLDLFRIPEAVLPEVLPSVARFDHASALAGHDNAPPIFGVAGDQQAALFGQAGWEPGTAKNTYGTGCFLLLNTGVKAVAPQHGLLSTAAAGPGGSEAFALEGSVFVAGAAVQWLRDELGLIREAAESEALARSVNDTGGVYLVPAFAGLGTPYWDPRARGAIVGLTRGSGRAQIVRAALESIAYQTCDVVEAMRASGCPVHTLRVDGGACANDFLMQFQADLLGVPVERAAVRETTALGAAYMAGLGCGLWAPSDLGHLWKADRVFEPAMSPDQREALLGGWRRAVERARDWA